MARNVADVLWEMLEKAGVQRCYGIVGDALNPVIDALHRNGKIEFIHVRHEEYGVFAAVADSYLSGRPVAVCGTAGPGVTHLFNGLMDARKEGASVIAIAGDVETKLIDTSALEEAQPLQVFRRRVPLCRAHCEPRADARRRQHCHCHRCRRPRAHCYFAARRRGRIRCAR